MEKTQSHLIKYKIIESLSSMLFVCSETLTHPVEHPVNIYLIDILSRTDLL